MTFTVADKKPGMIGLQRPGHLTASDKKPGIVGL
jgi:hypothetical protein